MSVSIAGRPAVDTDRAKRLAAAITSEAWRETLSKIARNGPTWDGDLVSKAARDALVEAGILFRFEGWQCFTPLGLAVAKELRLLRHQR